MTGNKGENGVYCVFLFIVILIKFNYREVK